MRYIILFFAAVLMLPVSAGAVDAGYSLEIEVWNFKNTRGQLGVSLFNGEAGFPMEYRKAHKIQVLQITGQTVKVVFSGLAPGMYAVAVHHDENSNNKLETNFFGVPVEGTGVSRDATGTFGPPDYEDAAFSLSEDRQKIRIKISY